MKKIFICIIILCIAYSCKKDNEVVFNASIDKNNITFVPMPGGAEMYYTLPNNAEIFYIQAKYTDFKGEKIIVTGSYLNNTITLNGFIDEQDNIPVEIVLLDNKGNRSAPQNMEFSVLKSAAKAIFDDIEVGEYWAGFQVKYTAPEKTKGFIHIGYIGINPLTKKLDTLLLKTSPILANENKLKFMDKADKETFTTDVVVWTEDYRGNIVHKEVYLDVPAAASELMNPDNFEFEGSSYESASDFLGNNIETSKNYLFDGDKNGVARIQNSYSDFIGSLTAGCYSFLSEKFAVPGEWILDIKEEKTLASVKLFCPLNTNVGWPGDIISPDAFLPNHAKIYASNDKINWVELAEFHEYITTEPERRWCYPSVDENNIYVTKETLEEAEPCYISFDFDYSQNQYRYIKIEILETFKKEENIGAITIPFNEYKQVLLSEIEVHVKK